MAKSKSLASVTIGEPDMRLSASHLVGDRPQPVPDDLVGQRVELVDLLLADGVGLPYRWQRALQLVRVDGPAGEHLGAGDEHGHDALPAVTVVTAVTGAAAVPAVTGAGRMVRLP